MPPPESAREAQKPFFCSLCSKGYSRMNEYEAHLSSYDHTHKQRLKDMKAMVRDPNAGVRARKAEAKADGLISIKFDKDKHSSTASTALGANKPALKRSAFKSAFAPKDAQPPSAMESTPKNEPVKPEPTKSDVARAAFRRNAQEVEGSESEDPGYEVYDPEYPTR